MDVSLILPCLNEMQVIEESLSEIENVLESTVYDYEIILVDDGSTDGTVAFIEQYCSKNPKTGKLIHPHNMGRGAAVQDGIRAARGKVVGYIDIDLEVPAYCILPLIQEIRNGADVATGHRVYRLDRNTFQRFIFSKGYAWLVRWLLKANLADTETGIKFFNRGTILPLLEDIVSPHWFWDTEIMVRAYYTGLKIKEIKVLFDKRPEVGSTVRLWADILDYLKNLRRFRADLKVKRCL
jgi:glycosyltransferase involved in cell wall biosynthesis